MNAQPDKRQFNVLSAATSILRNGLAAFMGYSHLGQRDLFKQFGYKRELDFKDFAALYKRNAVAARIIRAFPSATWKDCPEVCDDDNKEKDSPFEKAWRDFYEKNRVQLYFERADRLAGLGRYSVLLLGFDDGANLDQPLTAGAHKLLYMTPYAEMNAIVNKFDLDVESERFGLPLIYTLQKGNPFSTGRPTAQSKSMRVHYSRVLHIAELLDDDEVYGTPRLECTYNHLKDLEKVVGGSAETFWLNARQGLALMADKDANISAEALTDMKDQAQEFEHQLRRTLAMQGITPTVLNAQVADPEPNVSCLLDLIAGGQGMPKRILIGSERGELASSQDESNWSTRIEERRGAFATPVMLRPFIELMIATENLPTPAKVEWSIEWPEVAAQSPKEKSAIALDKANALRAYVSSPGAEIVIPQPEFREWLGESADSEYADDVTEMDPLNENDPNVASQFASTFGGKPADTAMNGLQISSLKDIVIAVGAKEMPPEAAVQLIMACFPNIDKEQAKAIIDPMTNFTPPEPKIPPQMAPGARPAPQIPAGM